MCTQIVLFTASFGYSCLFQLVYFGEKEVHSPSYLYTPGCTLPLSLPLVCCVVLCRFWVLSPLICATVFPGQLIHPSLPQAAGPSPQQTRTGKSQHLRCVFPPCSYTSALVDPPQLFTEMYRRGSLTPTDLQSILAPPSPSFSASSSPRPAGRFV